MESWVQMAVESSFVYILKSQLICDANYVSSSLTTLVCDCVDETGGKSCYSTKLETEIGVSLACANVSSVLKGPSSITTFSKTSISDLCTEVSLFLIQSSWFEFPRSPPSVSFQFADRKEKGVVLNGNGAEVGKIVGDGSHMVFKKSERVKDFTTCLLISADLYSEYSDLYPRRDFGFSVDNSFTTIRPFGLADIELQIYSGVHYWCAEISKKDWDGDEVSMFPIVTIEDFENKDEEYLSNRTESLLYALAACYTLDLVFLIIFIGVVLKKRFLIGQGLPLIFWLGVTLGIVCLFRIVFCFIEIDDGFSDLSQYVVFETPTFLLFSAVVMILVLFMQLTTKNQLDFKRQNKIIWCSALATLAFIWALFIIVTIVYSEIILEEEEESVCPGRVQSDNNEIQENTQTLSIVYQSVVIALTLIFALVFLVRAMKLFYRAKNSGTRAKVFIFRLGLVIVSSFLARTVLFIILLALDITSDIYLFITLLLTEVVMILCIALELNKDFYSSVANYVSNLSSGSGRGSSDPDCHPSSSFIWNDGSAFIWEERENEVIVN